MRDPYLYDDVPVLVNKGNIKDAEELKNAEGDITKFSMGFAYEAKFDKFNTETLCEIHKIIFGDLYEFAGEFRSIFITKSEEVLGGDTVRYAYPNNIKKELDVISKEISKLKKTESKKDLLFKIVRIIAAIWQTHPFREGNTRAIVTFSVLLAANLGIELDYELLRKNAVYVRNSLVWGSQGIYSKYEYLEKIYFDASNMFDDLSEEAQKTDTKDYTVVNGYYIADYKETPHVYIDRSEN